jgi:hypothetical protein
MKANTLHSFLEECRAAKTSGEIGQAVERIETKIGAVRADRTKFDGQLQEAIVAGSDPGKIHTAIAQVDQDLMTLEAARAGFSQRQEDARKREEGEKVKALVDRHASESAELEAATQEFAAAMEKARATGARVAGLAKQHGRTVDELEALKLGRPFTPASSIIRGGIGQVRGGSGETEYGRRIDIGMAEVLSDNPAIRVRAMVHRRGRVGETNMARDMATEGWMKLAKNIEAKAAG